MWSNGKYHHMAEFVEEAKAFGFQQIELNSILTIELASRVGAKAVVLHAGWVELDTEMESRLRELYEQGRAGSQEFQGIQKRLIEGRQREADAYLSSAE